MQQLIHGNLIHAPALGRLEILEHGWMLLEDGTIRGLWREKPAQYAALPVTDYGNALVMQSFADMHLHAPQYPMLGMGMDLPLLDWLNTYTFKTEARFADTDYARRVYRRLAGDLITNGTTRVCMFSSLHTEATWILMEELERAGVTGYVGKVNMDRNALPGVLEETTEESVRETIRWLDGCRFEHVRPIITPRFTPSCTDELMAELGKIARERGLYVQSHLSESMNEIAWVRELSPGCARYLLDAGVRVTLGSDIAGGAQLAMNKVVTMSIRASKMRRILDGWQGDFLTVEEGYYLGTTAGHRYFGAGGGFAVGDKLHAIVVDDGDLPEPTRPLSVQERFERALYMMHRHNITAVYSDGRLVVSR